MSTRYIGHWGSWCSFQPANMAQAVTPQGSIIEKDITPTVGDVFILPSDVRGSAKLAKYQALLPSGVAFGKPFGLDDNYFKVVAA